MSVDSDFKELESKVELLDVNQPNTKFLECVKSIMAYIERFDVSTTELRISSKVLPAVQNQFNKVFKDNYSIHEVIDDELMGGVVIKENLEVIFSLTEIVQELLNYVGGHDPVQLFSIKSILKYVPIYIQLFMEHWRSSSEIYSNAFIEELSKIFEAIKHLYAKFLNLLEYSINVQEGPEINLLVDTLIFICEMPGLVYGVDATSVISSWTCFGTVATKYSSMLENCLDVRIPIRLLTEDTCRLMEALDDQDPKVFQRQLKILTFLRRILFKILTDIFYKQLNNFASELLIFFIRVLSYPPEDYANKNFSKEGLVAVENEIFRNLDDFLQQSVLKQGIVKEHLINLNTMQIYEKYPLGFLSVSNKILQIIANFNDPNWSEVVINLTEAIFKSLPYCQKYLFLNSYKGGAYQNLIINISAAILMQDIQYQITDVLLKNVLQDNVFVAVLALEVSTLLASNIMPQECLLLLANILYGVDGLMCGFFTHRPEMVYLKCLLQRLFNILPDPFKEQVIKLFPVDEYVQIWRFLGFNTVPAHQIPALLEPVLAITTYNIKSINEHVNEEIPINIAEGLHLISTIDGLNMADPRFSHILKFLESFWSIDKISDKNLMKYFIYKISSLTASCIKGSHLDPGLVFSKLKLLQSNSSYWIAIFQIIFSILSQPILSHIAVLMPLLMKNNTLMQELYLEQLKSLNESHNDVLNMLLDSLDANTANQIFDYIDKIRKFNIKSINKDHFNNLDNFKHICLQWKDNNIPTCALPPAKRFKPDKPRPNIKKTQVIANEEKEEDSVATEIIDRLKGEVKCLINACKTEKLTPKNVADLKILVSKISSLI